MTVIVGVRSQGRVFMGADSQGTGGWAKTARADDKLFRLGELVVGFTTSYRMGQVLRYWLEDEGVGVPESETPADIERWAVRTFVPAVRKVLKEHGFAKVENAREEAGSFLVGWRAALFAVEDDLQAGFSRAPYMAAGVGREFALGALHACSELIPNDPEHVLGRALWAAADNSIGCGPPFVYLQTETRANIQITAMTRPTPVTQAPMRPSDRLQSEV